jgi:uncharacterized protein YybS (DUF2232 family)
VIQIIAILLMGLILILSSTFLFYRWGWKSTLFFLIPIGAVISLTPPQFDELHPLMLSLFIVGITAGYTFREKKSLQLYKNTDILDKSKENIVTIVNASNIQKSEQEAFLEQLDDSLEIVRDIIPFAYFINSLFFSLISFFFIRLFMKRYIAGQEKSPGLELFQLHDYFIYALILGWLAVLLVDKSEYAIIYITGLNIALIFSVLYLIQSLGIVKYFLIKKGLPLFIIPLTLITILFLGLKVTLFISIILSSVGAIDFWADFRKLGSVYNKSM